MQCMRVCEALWFLLPADPYNITVPSLLLYSETALYQRLLIRANELSFILILIILPYMIRVRQRRERNTFKTL